MWVPSLEKSGRRALEKFPAAPINSPMTPLRILLALGCSSLVAAPVTVFTNGKILTVDAAFSVTDALAVEGARIVAVGEAAKTLGRQGAGVEVVDLGGRTMLPGLMDSHSHPVGAATMEFDHAIPDIENIPQLLEYISSRAKSLPEGSLIGIDQIFITRLKEQRYPTLEELDRAAPVHPVQFRTGPDSMLNSAALRLAGIGRGFKVPAGQTGVVVFDEAGGTDWFDARVQPEDRGEGNPPPAESG